MEWRNRNALDMTLRMYCGLFVTVLQMVWMLLIDGRTFVADFGHREWKYLLVLLAEFLYFGSLWAYHWYRNRYDIFSPFTRMAQGVNAPGHRVVIMLTFISAVIPSMPW